MNEGSAVSVQELVDSYNANNNSKVNIIIYNYEKGWSEKYFIKSTCKNRKTHKIVYDPQNKLKIGQYSDSYYCNTFYDFSVILHYLFNEDNDIEEESEDILDLKETKRYSCFSKYIEE